MNLSIGSREFFDFVNNRSTNRQEAEFLQHILSESLFQQVYTRNKISHGLFYVTNDFEVLQLFVRHIHTDIARQSTLYPDGSVVVSIDVSFKAVEDVEAMVFDCQNDRNESQSTKSRGKSQVKFEGNAMLQCCISGQINWNWIICKYTRI